MQMLTRSALQQARQFVFEHGRGLDQARYRFHFEAGPAGAVLDELARYQNPDGGFGNALEPDLRTPASSAVATSLAFSVLRELGVDATEPCVRRAVDYLLGSFDGDRKVWEIVPPQVEDAPHAPWWVYAEIGTTFDCCVLNPTAGLLGALYDQPRLVPPDFLADLTEVVVDRVRSWPAFSRDTFRVVLRLAESLGLPSSAGAALTTALLAAAPAAVESAPAAWREYNLQPLDAATSPDFVPGVGGGRCGPRKESGLPDRSAVGRRFVAAHVDVGGRRRACMASSGAGVEGPLHHRADDHYARLRPRGRPLRVRPTRSTPSGGSEWLIVRRPARTAKRWCIVMLNIGSVKTPTSGGSSPHTRPPTEPGPDRTDGRFVAAVDGFTRLVRAERFTSAAFGFDARPAGHPRRSC